MIGRLTGIVSEKSAEGVLLDVHGVGYEVSLPLSTLAALPATGKETTLWIYTHVREDELRLFGFGAINDRTAFRTMLKVSGVGPKVALAVIGAIEAGALARAINEGDTRRLSAIPGIGKKTAERIILELGGKLQIASETGTPPKIGVFGELDSALKNLGFKPAEVDKAIEGLKKTHPDDSPFEVLLREGLSSLRGK